MLRLSPAPRRAGPVGSRQDADRGGVSDPRADRPPLPIQRPIPSWIGGQADAALRRVAALGEGWMPMIGPDLSVNTVGAGFSVGQHLDAIGRFKQVVEAAVQP
jgi:alkanesulfonate monooxygenase SsuD/methylene tetrahydromethanopterin reductase-like flavin-dependent oxidoreductase (luciferase family)